MNRQEWVTQSDLIAALTVSRSTLDRWRRDGLLKPGRDYVQSCAGGKIMYCLPVVVRTLGVATELSALWARCRRKRRMSAI